ncbi:MAG: peptide deformylase [Puniceicoccales bacterium]|nr:peptide deformylase [Puniceicoccales bacterium]
MSVASICLLGNPALRTPATEVKIFDQPRKNLYRKMLQIMHKAKGIGIAAQQVGWTERVCIIDLGSASRQPDIVGTCIFDGQPTVVADLMPLIVINPVVLNTSAEKLLSQEGCLSIPGIQASVERFSRITIRFQDEGGKEHTLECEKLFAICLQHETEHLDGTLFIDHLDEAGKVRIQPQLDAIRRRGEQQKVAPLNLQ